MEPPETTTQPQPPRGWIRELFRGHGTAVSVAAGVTIVVQCAVALVAGRADVPAARSAVATLAVATLWVALAAGPLSAGAETAFGAILRGGVVVDASIPALVLLVLTGPVTAMGAVKVYCILAAVALWSIAMVRIARTGWGRYATAMTASAVLFAMLASPLWVGGLLEASGGAARRAIVWFAVAANPFYAVAAATVESTGFVWQEAPLMYRLTPIGDHVAAPTPAWYATVVIYGCVAAMLAGASLVRKNRPIDR